MKAIPSLVLSLILSLPAAADIASLAKSSGVQGGLIVHLGCKDGRETAKLLLNDRFLVHGLDTDAAALDEARKNLRAAGVYGKVSVYPYDGAHLPYVDQLVNLLIAPTGRKVTSAEILRVLVPGGVAMVGGEKVVKPWPKNIDEWTHYLHGPDNNAVAADTRIDIPRSIQWASEPRWGRSHEELASMSAAVTAAGRVFYVVDEAPLASIRFLGDWKLVARDAFNGTLLWKKPVSPWNDHLRHFRSGPVHLPRRLVAVGQTVYVTPGFDKPLVALDAATGETIRTYAGTAYTEEILVDDGVLYLVVGTSESSRRGGGLFGRNEPKPSGFRYVAAIRADTGRALWKKDFSKGEYLLPLSLAVKGPRVYCQSSGGVICLNAADGKERWRTPRSTPGRRMGFSSPTVVATDEVLLVADRDPGKGEENSASTGAMEWGVHGWNEKGFPRKGKCTLQAYAAADGKELWSAPCSEGYNSPVDLFVVGGTVWVGTGFKGYNVKTGSEMGQIDRSAPRVGMPHHRCYRDKATTRLLLTGKSGIEVLSFDQKRWLSNNSWIRGTCQYGILPANGFLYAPPDACGCFLTVKVQGFFAAAPQRDKTLHMPFPSQPVLEKGPAYARISDAAPKAADPKSTWPMYRNDAARSGTTPAEVPTGPKAKWVAKVGPGVRLTQPVVGGGKVFVVSVDDHTVHALDAGGGKERWQFTAGGRIDSSPTLHGAGVYFGAADGWIYCISADDGSLAWRFRAAPQERLVCAYGQLESIWPVHGAVLIQNGTLYATAGRNTYLDGGLVLYRLDPATGTQRSRTVFSHLDPDTGKQLTAESGFNMDGTLSEILSGDGESVFLKYFTFDAGGKLTDSKTPRLYAIAGLLGEEWFVRSYWVLGAGKPSAGWSGWARAANAFPAGRVLCFNDENVYGYGRVTVSGGPTGHKAEAYHLFAASRKAPTPPAPKPAAAPKKDTGKKARRRRAPKGPAKAPPIWRDTESLIARAILLGGERLVVAGPVGAGRRDPKVMAFTNDAEALAAFRGEKENRLRVISAANGKTICERKLPAMPVLDGLSAGGGRLYLSLKNGTVLCLGD